MNKQANKVNKRISTVQLKGDLHCTWVHVLLIRTSELNQSCFQVPAKDIREGWGVLG